MTERVEYRDRDRDRMTSRRTSASSTGTSHYELCYLFFYLLFYRYRFFIVFIPRYNLIMKNNKNIFITISFVRRKYRKPHSTNANPVKW